MTKTPYSNDPPGEHENFTPVTATYTMEQIKEAFWDVFYEAGEVWFGHAYHEGSNESVLEHFRDFLEALTNLTWDEVCEMTQQYEGETQ